MSASPTVAVVGELIWVPIEDLHPNPWNPNVMDDFMFSREVASVEKFGIIDPITARVVDGQHQIVDGEHRWKAAKQLEHAEVPVWSLGEIPDHVAKQLTLALNEIKGTHERGQVAEILRDLLASEPTQELLRLLPYSEESFAELVDLPPFDWDDFDRNHPKAEAGGEQWIEKVYRLPLEAAATVDRAIAKAREDDEMQEWRALELICADFLGGQ